MISTDVEHAIRFANDEEQQRFLDKSYFCGAFSDDAQSENEPLCPLAYGKKYKLLTEINVDHLLSRGVYNFSHLYRLRVL